MKKLEKIGSHLLCYLLAFEMCYVVNDGVFGLGFDALEAICFYPAVRLIRAICLSECKFLN